jgi:hypothetical protein
VRAKAIGLVGNNPHMIQKPKRQGVILLTPFESNLDTAPGSGHRKRAIKTGRMISAQKLLSHLLRERPIRGLAQDLSRHRPTDECFD